MRQPTTLDLFVSPQLTQKTLNPALTAALQRRARSARAFMFDPDACVRAAELIRDLPTLIYEQQEFARAPFEQAWIELTDFPAFHQTINPGASEASDSALAFYVEHDTAYTISRSGNSSSGLLPLAYDLHTPWEVQEQLHFASLLDVSRLGIDEFLWGAVVDSIPAEKRRSLRDHHRVRLLPNERGPQYVNPALKNSVAQSCSDLRTLIALLLLLNRPDATRYDPSPPRSKGFIRGKIVQYWEHHVVKIPLDPRPTMSQLGTEFDRAERRRHEVRGHWCRDRHGRSPDCVHDWRLANDFGDPDQQRPADRYRCGLCGGKRWWRSEHVRGDAGTGFITKNYAVTP